MVLTRSSQKQSWRRSKTIEELSPMMKNATRSQKKRQQSSSYQTLSKTSRAKLTKLSNHRMAKADQLKKLKNSLKRKSVNYGSFVIRTSEENIKTEVKNEILSEEEDKSTDQPFSDEKPEFSIKSETMKSEPSEEVESIAQILVSSVEFDVMRDLLRNYIRMVAISDNNFSITYNPLLADLWELTPDQFYELMEILRDTDFLIKNANVARVCNDNQPAISFNCKVIHKNNVCRMQEKRVVVKATLIKGTRKLREMLAGGNLSGFEDVIQNSLKKAVSDSMTKQKFPTRKVQRDNRTPSYVRQHQRKSVQFRRTVTEFDRPTILKRSQFSINNQSQNKAPEEERKSPPRKMFNLDNTGKLIVEKKLPGFSLKQEPTPATALSASERLKMRKEAAFKASEMKKRGLKNLQHDVDLDANQDEPIIQPPVIPGGSYSPYVTLPLPIMVPTFIRASTQHFR